MREGPHTSYIVPLCSMTIKITFLRSECFLKASNLAQWRNSEWRKEHYSGIYLLDYNQVYFYLKLLVLVKSHHNAKKRQMNRLQTLWSDYAMLGPQKPLDWVPYLSTVGQSRSLQAHRTIQTGMTLTVPQRTALKPSTNDSPQEKTTLIGLSCPLTQRSFLSESIN